MKSELMERIDAEIERAGARSADGVDIKLGKKVDAAELVSVLEELQSAGFPVMITAEIHIEFDPTDPIKL